MFDDKNQTVGTATNEELRGGKGTEEEESEENN